MKRTENSANLEHLGPNSLLPTDIYAVPPHLMLPHLQALAEQGLGKRERISQHEAQQLLHAQARTCTLLTHFPAFGGFLYLLTWSDPQHVNSWDWVGLWDHEPESTEGYLTWCYADRHYSGSFQTDRPLTLSKADWIGYCSWNKDKNKYEILCKEPFMWHPHWMADLAADIQGKKLREVVLPATHDSATYGITGDSAVSPDLQDKLRKLPKKLISLWAKTQVMDVEQQLNAGYRCLDLRVARKGDGEFWIYHGLYSVKLAEVLNAVKRFHDCNPRELILLMLSHFMDGHGNQLEPEDHRALLSLLKVTFGPSLAQNSLGVDAEVQDFWNAGTPILIVYDYYLVDPVLWTQASTVVVPYSEKDFDSADSVIAWLKENVIPKDYDKFWVLPLIVTEDLSVVLQWTVTGGLARWTYDTAVSEFTSFYQSQCRKMNIIAVDYINFYPLVNWAIERNRERAPRTQEASA